MNKNNRQHPSKGTALQVAMAYAAYCVIMGTQLQEMFEAHQMSKNKAAVKRIVNDINLCNALFNRHIASFLDAQDTNSQTDEQQTKKQKKSGRAKKYSRCPF